MIPKAIGIVLLIYFRSRLTVYCFQKSTLRQAAARSRPCKPLIIQSFSPALHFYIICGYASATGTTVDAKDIHKASLEAELGTGFEDRSLNFEFQKKISLAF